MMNLKWTFESISHSSLTLNQSHCYLQPFSLVSTFLVKNTDALKSSSSNTSDSFFFSYRCADKWKMDEFFAAFFSRTLTPHGFQVQWTALTINSRYFSLLFPLFSIFFGWLNSCKSLLRIILIHFFSFHCYSPLCQSWLWSDDWMTNNCYSNKRIDFEMDKPASDSICMHENFDVQKTESNFYS